MSICRVLIIEDDDDTRESLAIALADAGFQVEQAADGRSVQRRLGQGEKFDVALVDVHLPGPSCEEMIGRMQSEGIRVILVTGDTSARVLRLAQQAKLLRKPMALQDLEAAVKEACAA